MLGTVPDFAFDGTGVRLSGVTANTPAARAGLQPGDIIVGLNNAAVQDLRTYATLLNTLQPGDPVTIRFLRQGREQQATATLTAR
jgi:S1-C subfamily serine protease